MLKQVIIVRTDLKMSKGKLAAQVAHAAVEAVLKTPKEVLEVWRAEGGKKVILKVSSENELLKLRNRAVRAKLKCALIRDAGLTELPPGTITALGIGPDIEEKIDKITGELKSL